MSADFPADLPAAAAAANLLLQLSTDISGLPLTPQHITPLNPTAARPSSAGFSTPSKTPTSNSRTAAPASSGKKSSKKSSSSKSQQQQQDGSSSSSGAKHADVAAQWQLRLLQGGVDWSNVKHRQLLQQLAHQQLMGRMLLPGMAFGTLSSYARVEIVFVWDGILSAHTRIFQQFLASCTDISRCFAASLMPYVPAVS
jgi:hypothetical protein